MRRRRPGRPAAATSAPEDGASLCWDFAAARGAARAARARGRRARADRRPARSRSSPSRLCDVAPDGSVDADRARRAQPHASRRARPRRPGRARRARCACASRCSRRPTRCPPATRCGSRVSPTYWPWVWPSPEPVTLTAARRDARAAGARGVPARRRAEAVRRARDARPGWRRSTSASARPGGSCTATSRRAPRTSTFAVDRPPPHAASDGTLLGERNVVRYRLTEGDPLSAEVDCEVEVELGRGDWGPLRVVAAGEMTSTAERLPRHHAARRATRAPSAVHARAWTHEIPRDGGMRDRTTRGAGTRIPAVARRERDRIFMRSVAVRGPRDRADRARLATSRRRSAGCRSC